MPPVRRFWFVYFLFLVICLALLGGALYLRGQPNLSENAWVLFGGVVVAALAIVANAYTQWRSSSVAHALDGLQTLRTDREYLINAYVVRQGVGAFGEPLSPEALAKFEDTTGQSTVDAPTFRDAALFVLNQYEFMAAGVRAGVVDYTLMASTMRGPIVGIVQTFAVPIKDIRLRNPKAYNNLLWLYRRFRSMPPFDRGPIP